MEEQPLCCKGRHEEPKGSPTFEAHHHVLVAAAHCQQGGVLAHTKQLSDLTVGTPHLAKGNLALVPARKQWPGGETLCDLWECSISHKDGNSIWERTEAGRPPARKAGRQADHASSTIPYLSARDL